ncbi:MAG: cold-shock protein [Caldilineaceae bacterium]
MTPNRRIQDEILYCDRCGISFLWPVEEQRAPESAIPDAPSAPANTPDAPRCCAGCRMLMAAPQRERGMVKWYSMRKRYGFVVRRDQAEIFMPGSSLVGVRLVQPGDLVEFAIGANEQGPIAEAVRLVASAAEIDVPLAESETRRTPHNPAARTRRLAT